MPDYQVFAANRTGEARPQTGRHARGVDAKREFILRFGEVSSTASDATIQRHWPSMRRNHNVTVRAVYDSKPCTTANHEHPL